MKRSIMGTAVVVGIVGLLFTGVATSRAEARERGGREEQAPRSSVLIPTEEAHYASLARVTIEAAVAAAKTAVPEGVVIAAELGEDEGGLIWEVDVVKGADLHEVKIDAGNAAVLANEIQEEDEGGEARHHGGRGGRCGHNGGEEAREE